MGKGLTAAVMAAGVRTALRVTMRFNPLEEAVRRTASSMEEDFSDAATFTTLFVGQLCPADGSIRYIDAGHGLALIIPASGRIRHLLSHDPPLGAVPGQEFTVQEAHLDEGDTLLIFSDGILDAFSDIPAAIAAAEALTGDREVTAAEMVDRIMELGESEHLEDDLTAVVVRRRPAA
jgi:serine phosphatase RsbU (regulator of sigma subunit)